MPVIPQKEAGCLIEPPVSVPVAKVHKFAFTAAAEPPEDPPGLLRGLIGFLTFPKKLVSFAVLGHCWPQIRIPRKK